MPYLHDINIDIKVKPFFNGYLQHSLKQVLIFSVISSPFITSPVYRQAGAEARRDFAWWWSLCSVTAQILRFRHIAESIFFVKHLSRAEYQFINWSFNIVQSRGVLQQSTISYYSAG
jgi:hypothetical protein